MKKLLLAGAIGAAASYLLDRDHGQQRRRRLLHRWRDSRAVALDAGMQAATAVEPLSPVPARVIKRMRRDARGSIGKRATIRLLRTGRAGLVPAALVYFAHPSQGAARRRRAAHALQTTSARSLKAARSVAGAAERVIAPVLGKTTSNASPARRRRSPTRRKQP